MSTEEEYFNKILASFMGYKIVTKSKWWQMWGWSFDGVKMPWDTIFSATPWNKTKFKTNSRWLTPIIKKLIIMGWKFYIELSPDCSEEFQIIIENNNSQKVN